MLCADARRSAVWPTEDYGAAHLAAGHVQGLGSGVNDLVNRLHGKIKGHELDHWSQAHETGSNSQSGETMLSDWGINHSSFAKFLK